MKTLDGEYSEERKARREESHRALIFVEDVPLVNGNECWAWVVEKSTHRVESPNPLYHRLIDRLEMKYPCLCDIKEEMWDSLGIWSDGPIRHRARFEALGLDVVESRVDEARPYILKVANDLGLYVFDMQAREVYYPAIDLILVD